MQTQLDSAAADLLLGRAYEYVNLNGFNIMRYGMVICPDGVRYDPGHDNACCFIGVTAKVAGYNNTLDAIRDPIVRIALDKLDEIAIKRDPSLVIYKSLPGSHLPSGEKWHSGNCVEKWGFRYLTCKREDQKVQAMELIDEAIKASLPGPAKEIIVDPVRIEPIREQESDTPETSPEESPAREPVKEPVPA